MATERKISLIIDAKDSEALASARRLEKAYNDVSASANGVGVAIGSFAGQIAGDLFSKLVSGIASIPGQLKEMSKAFADEGSKISDSVQKIGLSAEALSTIDFFGKLSGSGLDQFVGAFSIFEKKLADGTKKSGESFRAMGIDVAKGLKDPESAFSSFLEKINSMKDGTEKTALANKLFGKSATDLIPTFAALGTNFNEAKEYAQSLGVTLGTDAVANADALGDSLDKLSLVSKGVSNQFSNAFAPEMTKVFTDLGDISISSVSIIIDQLKEMEAQSEESSGNSVGFLGKAAVQVVPIAKFAANSLLLLGHAVAGGFAAVLGVSAKAFESIAQAAIYPVNAIIDGYNKIRELTGITSGAIPRIEIDFGGNFLFAQVQESFQGVQKSFANLQSNYIERIDALNGLELTYTENVRKRTEFETKSAERRKKAEEDIANLKKRTSGIGDGETSGGGDRQKRSLAGDKAPDSWREIKEFAESMGFTMTSGKRPYLKNKTSPHPLGFAADIRTRDKSEDQIGAFVAAALEKGFRIVDERRFKASADTSGPHLHVEKNLNRASRFDFGLGYGKFSADYIQKLDADRSFVTKQSDKQDRFFNSADQKLARIETMQGILAKFSSGTITTSAGGIGTFENPDRKTLNTDIIQNLVAAAPNLLEKLRVGVFDSGYIANLVDLVAEYSYQGQIAEETEKRRLTTMFAIRDGEQIKLDMIQSEQSILESQLDTLGKQYEVNQRMRENPLYVQYSRDVMVLDEKLQLERESFDIQNRLATFDTNSPLRIQTEYLRDIVRLRQQEEDAVISINRSQLELAQKGVFSKNQADAGFLDYLNRQVKGVTEIYTDLQTQIGDKIFGSIDKGLEKITKKLGFFGELAQTVLSGIIKQMASKFLMRLFGLDSGSGQISAGGNRASGGGFLGGLFGGGGQAAGSGSGGFFGSNSGGINSGGINSSNPLSALLPNVPGIGGAGSTGATSGSTGGIFGGLSKWLGIGSGKGTAGAIGGLLPGLGLGLGGSLGGQSGAGNVLGSIGGLAGGLLGSALLTGSAATMFGGAFAAGGALSIGGLSAAMSATVVLAPIAGLLLAGALILKRNAARRRDEKTRNSSMIETLKGLNDILTGLNATPPRGADSAVSSAESLSSSYFSMANGLKDKKTRNIALKDGNERVTPLVRQISELAPIAKMRGDSIEDRRNRLVAEFASGVFINPNFQRRNGMLPGTFSGRDTLPSMLAPGEMVLNPMQQNAVRRASGFDPFKYARIPGYADGVAVAPTSANSAPVVSVGGSPVVNVTLVLQGDTFNDTATAYLKTADGKRQVVNVVKEARDKKDIRF
jgi:hypothetical protein